MLHLKEWSIENIFQGFSFEQVFYLKNPSLVSSEMFYYTSHKIFKSFQNHNTNTLESLLSAGLSAFIHKYCQAPGPVLDQPGPGHGQPGLQMAKPNLGQPSQQPDQT